MIDAQVNQVVARQARNQGELAPAQACPRLLPQPFVSKLTRGSPMASPRSMNQSPRSTRFITRNSPARRCQLT